MHANFKNYVLPVVQSSSIWFFFWFFNQNLVTCNYNIINVNLLACFVCPCMCCMHYYLSFSRFWRTILHYSYALATTGSTGSTSDKKIWKIMHLDLFHSIFVGSLRVDSYFLCNYLWGWNKRIVLDLDWYHWLQKKFTMYIMDNHQVQ